MPMASVVGVRFRPATKIYDFSCDEIPDLTVGDWVIVETARGPDAGMVVVPPRQDAGQAARELKPVLRRATALELYEMYRLREREPAALQRCRELVAEHKLPMKVLKAEYNYDGSRLVFYFTAEGRVDFRGLLHSLARAFKTRIDLHQVGARDEAKLTAELGICGRLLCCRDWLTEFNKVSIRMAKHQDLSLNPAEISGTCGRLLCCLAYEEEYYRKMKQALPQKNQLVETPKGRGVVTDVNVITEVITVRLEDDQVVRVPAEDVRPAVGSTTAAGRRSS
jgi:cell fate regulator YaaT (PSP1 superfamily)